jgi:GWxTD domain-containing protein
MRLYDSKIMLYQHPAGCVKSWFYRRFSVMRVRNRLAIQLLLIMAGAQVCPGQFGLFSPSHESQQLHSHVIAFPTDSPDTSQLLIFIKIENAELQFVKTGDQFKAGYELTLSVENNNHILFSQIKRGSVKVPRFNDTQSRHFKYEFFRAFLRPGTYILCIQLYDLETKEPIVKKEELSVPDYRERSLVISDILFLNEIKQQSLEDLQPVMPPIRTASDTAFCARIDLFSSESRVTLYETIKTQEETVYRDTVQLNLVQRRKIIYFKLNQDLLFGEYILSIRAVNSRAEETVKARFYTQAQDQSATLPNIETAVAALVYIMDKKQWNALQDASEDEQKQIIKTYWKNRNPDPDSGENALETEYYRRVRYANRQFSVFKNNYQGWKTDRGHVYILYGPPTDIDRPLVRSATEGRFEIWVYHQLQRRFVFYDKYSDGDYRLISQE